MGNEESNTNLAYGSSTVRMKKYLGHPLIFYLQPVNFYKPNSNGFYDVSGNVWECTEDQFDGLPGFKTHYLYDDYSGPSFDGRHNILLVYIPSFYCFKNNLLLFSG